MARRDDANGNAIPAAGDGGGRPSGSRPFRPMLGSGVADGEMRSWPGTRRSGPTRIPSVRSASAPNPGRGGRGPAYRQIAVRQAMRSSPTKNSVSGHVPSPARRAHLDAQPRQQASALADSASGKPPSTRVPPSPARCASSAGDGAEVARPITPPARRPRRHLDAGGACADHHEGQQRVAPRLVGFGLGPLEGEQDLAADGGRIVERLDAGGERRPVVAPEIESRAGRQDQPVASDRRALGNSTLRPRRSRRRGRAGRGCWRRSSGSRGWARRCRPATGPPSPPDRAAAGRRDGCADRSASPRRRAAGPPGGVSPPKPAPAITTCGLRGGGVSSQCAVQPPSTGAPCR